MKPILMVLTGFFLADALFAESPEEKGRAIAAEARKRDRGWGDFTANTRMILRNKLGQESTRETRSRNLEQQNDGDKTLVVFDTPRDVKGTAFLSFTHVKGPDDQWLYLPAIKRVKRISTNNKSGPFMGSEFAYEDISSQEVEKYTYKYLRDDWHDKVKCFVVERYPADPKSGYTRQIAWYDQVHYRILRVDFYDRKDALLKRLTYHGYRQFLDRYWRPEKMRMVNLQKSKETDLMWFNYKFGTGLSERDFDPAALKRIR